MNGDTARQNNVCGETVLDVLAIIMYLLGIAMAILAMYKDVFIIEHFIIAMFSLSSLVRMHLK